MTKYTVAVTDYGFPDLHQEEDVLLPMGFEFVTGQCKTPDEVMQLTRHADAILIERAPITKEVIENLERCKIIVRYGVGVDSVDIQAAKERNIPVVNVPGPRRAVTTSIVRPRRFGHKGSPSSERARSSSIHTPK